MDLRVFLRSSASQNLGTTVTEVGMRGQNIGFTKAEELLLSKKLRAKKYIRYNRRLSPLWVGQLYLNAELILMLAAM